MLFKVMWTLDAVACLIILYFFVEGLGDNTINGRNSGIWMIILGALVTIMVGSVWLRNNHYPIAANLLLLVLLIPGLLFVLYMLIALLGGGRWN